MDKADKVLLMGYGEDDFTGRDVAVGTGGVDGKLDLYRLDNRFSTVRYLARFFDADQLGEIEAAFEVWDRYGAEDT